MLSQAEEDPFALRHGILVSSVWTCLAELRPLARNDEPDLKEVLGALRLLRALQIRLQKAQRAEEARRDFPVEDVQSWFASVSDSVDRAIAHFAGFEPAHPFAHKKRPLVPASPDHVHRTLRIAYNPSSRTA